VSIVDRRVVLGGQTRARGIIGGARQPLEWVGMVVMGSVAVPVVTTSPTFGRVVVAAAIVGAAYAAFTPWPGRLAGRSAAAVVTGRIRSRRRRRVEPFFCPGLDFSVPEAVGRAKVVRAAMPDGAEVAVVRHSNPGQAHAWTVAFEMVGAPAGMTQDWEFGAAHEAWGRFCATLARQGSLIRTVQQVMRVVPYDTTDHTRWVMDRIPALAATTVRHDVVVRHPGDGGFGLDPQLGASYVELLDDVKTWCEQHRSWVVFRVPVTTDLTLEARRAGGGEDGELVVVMREVAAAVARASAYGLALRPLYEPRLAGVLRALQDPSWPVDQMAERRLVADVAGPRAVLVPLTFETAWLPADQSQRRHVVVNALPGGQPDAGPARWWTRTAAVPDDGIEPGRFAPDFLYPLLCDVSPSVVRTVTVTTDLVPAHLARSRAKRDVTLDTASAREAATTVSDGSQDEQLDASQQRLTDLRAGTGHQGADWAMTVTVAAPSPDALDTAVRQVEDAAEASHVTRLRWLDDDPMAGLVASLPLCKAMKVTK